MQATATLAAGARTAADASLRLPAVWMAAGMAVYSACQWLMIAALAKLGSVEMVGVYAMAAAVCTPVFMLAQLNLRALITTDVDGRHRFEDYRRVRLVTLAAAFTALAAHTFVLSAANGMVILLAAAGMAVEWHSDTYQSLMLRQHRNGRVAVSLILRSLLSLGALIGGLALTSSLAVALTGVAAARLSVCLLYDAPASEAPAARSWGGPAPLILIFRTALPLGVVLVLASLTTNVPRYFIGGSLGDYELGIFSGLASLATAGSLFVNAIGQTATPRLAALFHSAARRQFWKLTLRLTSLALALGLAGVAVAAVAGGTILAAVYTSAYAGRRPLLVWIMASAAAGYVASMLGYVITACRQFRAQIPLQAAVLGGTCVAAWILIPINGLEGAALAVAAGSVIQVAGEIWILRLALAPKEPA